MKINYFLGLLGVVGLAAFANAEQTLEQNPCLYYPDSCRSGGSVQSKKVINIPTHWGAVAVDLNKSIAGVSEDQKSERKAKKQAIRACKNRGGKDCKILGMAKNACIAYGFTTLNKSDAAKIGSEGYLPVMVGNSTQEAEAKVVKSCKDDGGVKCQVYYSHCNKDPRYDMY